MPLPERLTTSDHSRDNAGLRYVYAVESRRAGGVSIGINLNPNNACNWRCIYCQVPGLVRGAAPEIELEVLGAELRQLLGELTSCEGRSPRRHIVDIALSGNGEPTSAAAFPEVVTLIGEAIEAFGLAGQVVPRLITNGSLVRRDRVSDGLRRLSRIGGEVWFKLDAGTAEGFRRINDTIATPDQVAARLAHCASLCRTWVQTCVFALDGRGPSEEDIGAYLDVLTMAGMDRLAGVHLYGLARNSFQPEAPRLSRLDTREMEAIAARIRSAGLTVHVSP